MGERDKEALEITDHLLLKRDDLHDDRGYFEMAPIRAGNIINIFAPSLLLLLLFIVLGLISIDDCCWATDPSCGLGNSIASGTRSAFRGLFQRGSNNYGVTERAKKKAFEAGRIGRGFSPDDKSGLAMFQKEFDDATKGIPTRRDQVSPNVLHKYQSIDLDRVVDNIFTFTMDIKHPPRQKLNGIDVSTKEEKSIIDSLKDRVKHGIEAANKYTSLVLRYQHWYRLHRKLERLDPQVGGYLGLAWREFSKVMAELREETSMNEMSGASPERQSEYERSLRPNRDFILEALNKTIDKLEEQLQEEDSRNLLGSKMDLTSFNNDGDDNQQCADKGVTSLKSLLWKEAKTLLIKEAHHFVKDALSKILIGYVLSKSESPSEGTMMYAKNLLEYLGTASLGLAVDSLRDQETRTALTLLDLISPMQILMSLATRLAG